MTTKIAISTPTGNIGSKVTEHLLRQAREQQLEIVLLARKPEKVARFAELGARIEQGNLDDLDFVVRATKGVDAFFWLTPQNFRPDEDVRAGYARYGRVGAEAIRQNGIRHVVHLSGFQAPNDDGGSIISGLKDVERLLDEVAPNITHVRAGFFFENYLGQLDAIRDTGSVYFPVQGDTPVAMTATRDIAATIAHELGKLDWTGHRAVSVLGPTDLTFDDAANALGQGLGRTVTHVTVTPEQAREAMTGAGMSPGLADGFLQIFAANDRRGLISVPARDARSTTETSLEDFARTVVLPLLNGSEAKGAAA